MFDLMKADQRLAGLRQPPAADPVPVSVLIVTGFSIAAFVIALFW
jgi:hypothetical protein